MDINSLGLFPGQKRNPAFSPLGRIIVSSSKFQLSTLLKSLDMTTRTLRGKCRNISWLPANASVSVLVTTNAKQNEREPMMGLMESGLTWPSTRICGVISSICGAHDSAILPKNNGKQSLPFCWRLFMASIAFTANVA